MSRLVFYEKSHRYRLDGEWVPSVTGVTGKVGDKNGLMNKAVELAATYALNHVDDLKVIDRDVWLTAVMGAHRREWDRARDNGTMLHAIAETLVNGEPMPTAVDDKPVPDDVRRMAEQLARFYDAWSVEPVLIEALGYHEEHLYAGKLDLVADLAGTRWLLDYKTSASGIWPETALQVCAYAHMTHYVDGEADRPMADVGIERCGAVAIRPDSWELIPLRTDDAMFGVFLHADAVAQWSRLRREASVGNPVPAPRVAS